MGEYNITGHRYEDQKVAGSNLPSPTRLTQPCTP